MDQWLISLLGLVAAVALVAGSRRRRSRARKRPTRRDKGAVAERTARPEADPPRRTALGQVEGAPTPRTTLPGRATGTVIRGPAWVIDGDTLVIGKTRIRLFGIDAPELDHPYGQKSKWAMIRLCKGQVVTARLDGRASHDRAVAMCFLPDGRDLSAELVGMGLAVDWPKFSGGRYRHLETSDARSRMWRCDARQKGRLPPGRPGRAR